MHRESSERETLRVELFLQKLRSIPNEEEVLSLQNSTEKVKNANRTIGRIAGQPTIGRILRIIKHNGMNKNYEEIILSQESEVVKYCLANPEVVTLELLRVLTSNSRISVKKGYELWKRRETKRCRRVFEKFVTNHEGKRFYLDRFDTRRVNPYVDEVISAEKSMLRRSVGV